jgi:hypothetical protein
MDALIRQTAAEVAGLIGLGENRQPGKARSPGWRPDYPLEEQLRAAFIAALTTQDIDSRRMQCEVGLPPGDWNPIPNGLDLVIRRADGTCAAVCELKVGAIDQTLWDLFKVTAAAGPALAGRYLVVVGPRSPSWRGIACGEVFPPGPEPYHEPDTYELFARHPEAWRALLRGNKTAVLRSAPRSVLARLVTRERLTHWHAFELRIVRVDPGTDGTVQFDPISRWPLGLEHLAEGGTSPPPAPSAQPHPNVGGAGPAAATGTTVDCAGYEVPAKFKSRNHADAWLHEHVGRMKPEVYAAFENELRRRGWSTDELDERVRPLCRVAPDEPARATT